MTDEKDTYFSRAQADLELQGQGRFIKEVTTQVIASGPASVMTARNRLRPEKRLPSSLAVEKEAMTVWTDPSTLTDEQIESKLFELGKKLTEAGVAGGKICELESVKWRLEFEQKFRKQRKG